MQCWQTGNSFLPQFLIMIYLMEIQSPKSRDNLSFSSSWTFVRSITRIRYKLRINWCVHREQKLKRENEKIQSGKSLNFLGHFPTWFIGDFPHESTSFPGNEVPEFHIFSTPALSQDINGRTIDYDDILNQAVPVFVLSRKQYILYNS